MVDLKLVENNLVNDAIYKCNDCGEIFQVFSQSGTTNFCPMCASRDLLDPEEDDE